MYVIVAILVFGILITTHELGHFLVAKACGVKVNEFAVGMGPKLLKKQGKETLYTLRALPLGGFCAMEGEDGDSADPRAFSSQSAWKRLLILLAGVTMNFLFGLILIFVVFSGASGFRTPTLTGFMDGCPYVGEDGFQVGDTIYKIDGERTYFSSNVSTFLSRAGERPIDIVVVRDGHKLTLEDLRLERTVVTTDDNGNEQLQYGFYFGVKEEGFGAKLKYSWYCALDFVRMIRLSLADLFTGAVGVKDLSGVVGIVSMINDVGQASESARDAFDNIAYLAAFIAINLAVMNLLPIPALDGGRILFLILTWIVEHIIRRKIDPKYEGYVHAAGLVLLVGLMLFVMYNDVVRLIVR